MDTSRNEKELRRRIVREIAKEVRGQLDISVKDSLARRIATRISVSVMEKRLTSWNPLHLPVANMAYQFNRIPLYVNNLVMQRVARDLFSGSVLPYQEVMRILSKVEGAYLGKCVCRHSRVVSDLEHAGASDQGPMTLLLSDAEARHALDGILDRYDRLEESGELVTTDEELKEIFRRLKGLRGSGSADYSLGRLWEWMHPHCEIFVNVEGFTQAFRQSMQKNGKVWELSPRLLGALIEPLYLSRRPVFTTVSVVDASYAICICPGPEVDKGCLLTNWHYHADIEPALRPNTDLFFGQRKAPDGTVLPCERFPERDGRPCLGCGCEHAPTGC